MGEHSPNLDTSSEARPTPVVSIVIVSWNVRDILQGCLNSIFRESEPSTEVVVVDNASSDGTVEMLLECFPRVVLVPSNENLGFAKGNNCGFEKVTGQYVFILNPDTILSPGALARLSKVLDEDPGIGMVGPKLVSLEGDVDRACARREYTLGTALFCDSLRLDRLPGLGQFFRRRFSTGYDVDKPGNVEAISGAAMLVRRDVLTRVGGFGEEFRHCGEDIDFCVRVRQAGWRIWFTPESQITHIGGASSKKAVERTSSEAALSIHRYFEKHHGIWGASMYRAITTTIQVPKMISMGLLRLVSGRMSWGDFIVRLRTAWLILTWGARREPGNRR